MKHVTLIQQISNLLQIDDIKMQSFELYKDFGLYTSQNNIIYIKFKVDIGKGYMEEFNFKMQDVITLKSLFDKIAFHGTELLMDDTPDE